MGVLIFDSLPQWLQEPVFQNPGDAGLFLVFLGLAVVHFCYRRAAVRSGDAERQRYYAWLGRADLVLIVGGLMGLFYLVPFNLLADGVGLILAMLAPKPHGASV